MKYQTIKYFLFNILKKLSIFFLLVVFLFFVKDNPGHFPKVLNKTIHFISTFPNNVKLLYEGIFGNSELLKRKPVEIHSYKNKSNKLLSMNLRNINDLLIIIPRFNGDTNKSQIDVIDPYTNDVLHSYQVDTDKILDNLKSESHLLKQNKINKKKSRFIYTHPFIHSDGSLIFNGLGPLVKLDKCSNIEWINFDKYYHHSINFDDDNHYWLSSSNIEYSSLISNNSSLKPTKSGFLEDTITKIDTKGKLIFSKSIFEIFFENNFAIDPHIIESIDDITHINDVQPALFDTKNWRKGDLFISLRNTSQIIHYRPSSNKILKIINGSDSNNTFFIGQHDIDLHANGKISIFNNNWRLGEDFNSYVLIYDFESNKFERVLVESFKKNNIKTKTGGLHEYINEYLFIEESNNGRLVIFDNEGNIVWEYYNKNNNDEVFTVSWSRIIKEADKVQLLRDVYSKKCNLE